MSPTSVSCASCAAPLSVGSVKCDYCGVQIGGVALPRTDEPGWASPFAQTPGTSGASVDAVYTPAQRGPVDLAKFWPAVNRCFYKYSIFTGRASLAEYWWWTVFTFVATIVLGGHEPFEKSASRDLSSRSVRSDDGGDTASIARRSRERYELFVDPYHRGRILRALFTMQTFRPRAEYVWRSGPDLDEFVSASLDDCQGGPSGRRRPSAEENHSWPSLTS